MTFLVGNNTSTASGPSVLTSTLMYFSNGGYVASASGTATHLVCKRTGGSAGNERYYMAIYDSGGTLLSQTVVDGTEVTAATGEISIALQSPVAITSGQTYYIGLNTGYGSKLVAWTDAGDASAFTRTMGASPTYLAPSTISTASGTVDKNDIYLYADGTVGASVAVSSVSDATLDNGQTSVTITGSGFKVSQGSGTVIISPTDDVTDTNAVRQFVTTWSSDTSITFTAIRGTLQAGTQYLFVVNDDGDSNTTGYPVSFNGLTPIILRWNM